MSNVGSTGWKIRTIHEPASSPTRLCTRDAAASLELIRSLKADGKSHSEIESGTIYLDDGEAISLKEILSAVARHAKSAEAVSETIRYRDTPGERGYGRVLLTGKVPRKALARREDVQILDERGFPKRLMKSSTPFFVFEDTGEHWLVGSEQDRDLAIGWVRMDQCVAWPTRRLVYPVDKEIKRAIPKRREQIAVLLDAVAARDFYNSAHGLYILPMGKFRKGDRP